MHPSNIKNEIELQLSIAKLIGMGFDEAVTFSKSIMAFRESEPTLCIYNY